MSKVTSAPTPSQTVAARIRAFRKRRDLTLNQVADECAALGAPQLSFAALANIERGATAESRRKPRDVSLDELMVLARVFKVAPALLIFPLGDDEQFAITPDWSMTTWDAYRWFTGESYPGEDVAEHWAVPIYLYRKHESLRDEHAFTKLYVENHPDQDSPVAQQQYADIQRLWGQIKDVRAEMRRHGLTPPPAAGDIQGIDDAPRMFLTGSEVEARLAAGKTVRMVDGSRPDGLGPAMKPGDGAKLEADIHRARRFAADFLNKQEEGGEE